MQRKVKGSALVALGASVALVLAGCSGATPTPATSSGPVTMTFWHNSTTGDGKKYWEDTVAAFEKANPNVTINIQAIQNLSLIHISEPTRQAEISYAVFCLK